MKRITAKVEVSWRYFVLGVYKDRNRRIWRIYPIPFVRVTLDREKPASPIL